ncbi:MAG: hypothetical protein IKQ35_03310 [Bacilli bacterium]|nr:hypothetical protein [Bacilli bacterium]
MLENSAEFIDGNKISMLRDDILSYQNLINDTHNNINDIISGLIEKGFDEDKNLLKTLNQLKTSKKNIISNINSYNDDYNDVLKSFQKIDSTIEDNI